MLAYITGWGEAALPDKRFGFFVIYVIGPFTGAAIASLIFTKVIEPIMKKKKSIC